MGGGTQFPFPLAAPARWPPSPASRLKISGGGISGPSTVSLAADPVHERGVQALSLDRPTPRCAELPRQASRPSAATGLAGTSTTTQLALLQIPDAESDDTSSTGSIGADTGGYHEITWHEVVAKAVPNPSGQG